jgi:glutamate racemase
LSKFNRFTLGITDSGFGGLSMVNEFISRDLDMDIIYFADIKNAPYGNKSKEMVQQLVSSAVDFLLSKKVDAILLACNTATSVVVEFLREKLKIPVYGMEPAIKPALQAYPNEQIGVMATNLTLAEDRFLTLKNKVDPMNRVIPIPCPGLSELIDQEKWQDATIYIKNILTKPEYDGLHSIVLGCTHYIFMKQSINELFPNISLFDGNSGTANHIIQSSLRINSSPTRWSFFSNSNLDEVNSTAERMMNYLSQNQQIRSI